MEAAAEFIKVGENGVEARIRSACVLDDCRHFPAECWHRFSNSGDGGVPIVDSCERFGEEAF